MLLPSVLKRKNEEQQLSYEGSSLEVAGSGVGVSICFGGGYVTKTSVIDEQNEKKLKKPPFTSSAR